MRPSKPTLTLMILGLVGVLLGTAFKLNHLMGGGAAVQCGHARAGHWIAVLGRFPHSEILKQHPVAWAEMARI